MLNGAFLASQLLRERVGSRERIKIQFSRGSGLQPRIAKGFKYSRHEIAFDGFSPDSVAGYDLLVPLTISDAKYLNTIRGLIQHNRMPIPSLDCIELCDDKLHFNQTIAAGRFRDLIPMVGGELPFPYVVKKRIDEWAQHCFLVSNEGDAESVAALRADPDYISQEMVPGPEEYATHLLMHDGEIVYSITIRYTFGVDLPIKGKDQVLYTRICRSPYLDVFSAVLREINYEGLCCVNYKVSDNRPMILEINPRFGGSLALFFVGFISRLR